MKQKAKQIEITAEEARSLSMLVLLVVLQEKAAESDGFWTGAPFWKYIQSLNTKLTDALGDEFENTDIMKGEWVVNIKEQ